MTDGGSFDRLQAPTYFIASSPAHLNRAAHVNRNHLIAVNEWKGKTFLDDLDRFLDGGGKVFLDSGIFNLTNEHMREHGMTMDEALSLAPDEIDGFHELLDRYCEIVEQFRTRLWGYVELDQGGRENKKRTRAKLEADGLRPIPVYHPLNDGWDYFDELAARYDRICVGNIVQAAPPLRLRLLATLWERRRQYPHLWIHLLGMTPKQWLIAYPQTSCDSSTWISAGRWGRFADTAMLASAVAFETHFAYGYDVQQGHETQSSLLKSERFSAVCAHMMHRNWQASMQSYAAIGYDALGGARVVSS